VTSERWPLEDPAGFLLGVAAGARVFVERLRPRLTTQLGDGHQVQGPVDAAVAAGVVAVADGLAGALGGRGGQRGGPVEASEPALGKAPRVADLDQQLGDRYGRESAQLLQRAAAGLYEAGELARELLLFCVELGDLGAIAAQHAEPQRGRRVEPSPAGVAGERRQPGAHLRCVGERFDQLEREVAEHRLGF
jgi:hypothetical protein